MRIAEFERALLVRFPREQAEAWDHIGLSCGRPDDEVRSIACALDASLPSVQAAADAGANVLITHHPIHITAPDAVWMPVRATPRAPGRSSPRSSAGSR